DVPVERAVVEEQLVAQARATTGLDGDAQREIVTALLVEGGLRLGGGGVGELDTGGGGVPRSGHDRSPREPREGVGGVPRGAASPLHPSIPLSRYALCGTWVDSRPARRSPSLREGSCAHSAPEEKSPVRGPRPRRNPPPPSRRAPPTMRRRR